MEEVEDGVRLRRGVDIGTSGQKGWYVTLKLKGKVSDVGTFGWYGETVIITSGGKDYLFAYTLQKVVSWLQRVKTIMVKSLVRSVTLVLWNWRTPSLRGKS